MNEKEIKKWFRDHPKESKIILEAIEKMVEIVESLLSPLFETTVHFIRWIYEQCQKNPDLIKYLEELK